MFQFLWLSTKYSAVLRLSVDPIETLSLTWPVAKKKKKNKSNDSPANYCDATSMLLPSCIYKKV